MQEEPDDNSISILSFGKYIQGKSKEDFDINDKVQDAVIRRLVIIGEGIKPLPR